MATERRLRIGTRGSALALAQAGWVRDQLAAAGHPGDLIVIKTTGDRIQDRPLQAVGGKGLFTKEIEEALLDGSLDLAIHSLKDMPAEQPPGLRIGAVPRREDPRDVLIPRDHAIRSLADLPVGALVATGSLRRGAQLRRARPDLRIMGIRGNVDTRLRKVRAGEEGIEGTIVAAAGLKRLGVAVPEAVPIPIDVMLPAVGQGALAIQARLDDTSVEAALIAINDADAATCVAAERAFLERLEGSCTVPLAGHAFLDGSDVVMTGLVCGPDATPWYQRTLRSPGADARRTGGALAEQLLADGAAAVLEALRG